MKTVAILKVLLTLRLLIFGTATTLIRRDKEMSIYNNHLKPKCNLILWYLDCWYRIVFKQLDGDQKLSLM